MLAEQIINSEDCGTDFSNAPGCMNCGKTGPTTISIFVPRIIRVDDARSRHMALKSPDGRRGFGTKLGES